jgi:hypothetical protein
MLMDTLLENPCAKRASAYAEMVIGFQDWSVPLEEAIVLFLHDREWNWREGKPPIHDW